MLVHLTEVLVEARKHHYAVPAFDCTEDLMIRPILDTCEELRSPVILMALEHDLKGRGFDFIASIIKGVAPAYNIPIVLHLDHANNPEVLQRAIEYGFTSVMFDASDLPLDENIARTAAMAKVAHRANVSIEAELGHVAGKELEGGDGGETKLTKPSDVLKFVDATRVDALAVSIGTAHGVYDTAPNLDIARLKSINDISTVPLVLHGGSGTPEDQLQAAIANGIAKINLYSDLRIAMFKGLQLACKGVGKIDPLPNQMFLPINIALRSTVADKIALCMSGNRA